MILAAAEITKEKAVPIGIARPKNQDKISVSDFI
jgi:hypothetical protein